MRVFCSVLVLTVFLAFPGFSQQPSEAGNVGWAEARKPAKSIVKPAYADEAASEVLARDVSIPAKGFKTFESLRSFAGTSRVSVLATTLDTGTVLTNIRIGVAWAVVDGEYSWFILSDVIKGSSFAFSDHGSGNVPVGGDALKLIVWNDGSVPVKLVQLNVYAR